MRITLIKSQKNCQYQRHKKEPKRASVKAKLELLDLNTSDQPISYKTYYSNKNAEYSISSHSKFTEQSIQGFSDLSRNKKVNKNQRNYSSQNSRQRAKTQLRDYRGTTKYQTKKVFQMMRLPKTNIQPMLYKIQRKRSRYIIDDQFALNTRFFDNSIHSLKKYAENKKENSNRQKRQKRLIIRAVPKDRKRYQLPICQTRKLIKLQYLNQRIQNLNHPKN